MKKILAILACITVIFTLTACEDNKRALNNQNGVSEILEERTQQNPSDNSIAAETAAKIKNDNILGAIDVDLTIMSSTVVYSEVYNMISNPHSYKGKVIKMGGICDKYVNPATANTYYSCIIKDATACCAQGIEFVLTDDYSMPGGYPQVGDEIRIVGIFDTYMEEDTEYCRLKDASVVFVKAREE